MYQESAKGDAEGAEDGDSSSSDEGTSHKFGRLSMENGLREVTPVDNLLKDQESESGGSETSSLSGCDDPDYDDTDNYFFHVAFTPEECTIMCSKAQADRLFRRPLQVCRKLGYNDVHLVHESYINLQVDSDGLDKSLQIIQLTRPLSENGISLFFLSTHFGDKVLIPHRYKEKVLDILTEKNQLRTLSSNTFTISNQSFQYDTPNVLNFLSENDTKPVINIDTKLLLTGSRSGDASSAIVKSATIIATNKVPPYFSVTRTSVNEVSLILPKLPKERAALGFSPRDTIGSEQDVIIPIIVDLSLLPFDSPGIVAGLASKIMKGVDAQPHKVSFPFEMNYLSMARAGIIMIPEENVLFAAQVLNDEVGE